MRFCSRRSTVSILVISLFILSSFLTPVCGVSVSYQSGGGGGGTATISGKYNLDRSASLHETARFGSGEVFQGRTVVGTGENSLSQQVSGSGYQVENEIVSAGALSASTSVAACGDGASLNQAVAGGGNLGVSVQGSQGTSASGQEAVVLGGVISTSQSLTTGDGVGVASGQSTAMAGAAGYVSSGALSDENRMALAGSFLGDGEMTAALSTTSSSGERAGMGGEVSIYGATWIDDSDLEMVASQSGGVSVSGQQALADGGIGSFGLSAENADADVLAMVGVSGERRGASGGDGDMVSTNYLGGSYSSYELIGWRWNQQNPKIQLYLKNDANLANEGLSDQQAQTAISNAANTWDSAVAQNLFADGQTVIIDSTKKCDDVYDGYNVHAWKDLTDAPSALAYARTRYGGPIVDGYYQVHESDVSYNTRYGWSTDLNNLNGKLDVETVALHELGHTIGLADLYNLPSSDPRKSDYEQIMNLYDAPQRYLGNGDKTAARKLYGDPTPIARYIAFRAYNGQHTCAEGGGGQALVANRNWIQAWETFGLVDLGNNKVALRAYNGQYVCAEGGGGQTLIANRDWIGAWETFTLIDLGNNNVALRAYNGQHVCAEGGGGQLLVANRNWVQAWETFGLISV